MSGTEPFDAERHFDAMLASHGLAIAPEWRADALAHLVALKRAADLVMAFDLPDDAEPANLFEPGR